MPNHEELIETLRMGEVPETGLSELAVGLDATREQLELALATGIAFLRGEPGSGKTYLVNWLAESAPDEGWVWAYLPLANLDTPLYDIVGLYEAVVSTLSEDVDAPEEPDFAGLLAAVTAAGHQGLVIVADDVGTVLDMRRLGRSKSLNAIRQIVTMASDRPGLAWIFAGTPEFYDAPKGVAGLPELADLVASAGVIEVPPFDAHRLQQAGRALVSIYPASNREQTTRAVNEAFRDRLIASVLNRYGGDSGQVARNYLRQLITHLDMVEEDEEYDPNLALGFDRYAMTEASDLLSHASLAVDDDSPMSSEDVW